MPPIDFNGLDTHVHGPIRLGILTALQIDGALDFTTLKKRLDACNLRDEGSFFSREGEGDAETLGTHVRTATICVDAAQTAGSNARRVVAHASAARVK